MNTPIPVTVLSGFLGAGKTTVLKNILEQRGDKKVALIVNDMAELNIDSKLIKNEVQLSQTGEKLVEMSNGCICCTLREDLILEVKNLCEQGTYDALIIESTGIAEPLPVAQTFSYKDDESGIDLGQRTRLDTMVTVVDAVNIGSQLASIENVYEAGQSDDENDTRTIADLLLDQIEFANIIVANKFSEVDAEQQKIITALLKKLNPEAIIITTDWGKVNISQIVDTKLFDFDKSSSGAGRIKELNHEHTPETEEYGISSFVWTSTRACHPERLRELLNNGFPGLIRAKGFIRLASRPDAMLTYSVAGNMMTLGYGGRRLAAMTEEERNTYPELKELREEVKDKPNKDRKNEIVFIGQNLNKESIIQTCEVTLLNEKEINQSFTSFNDPFEEYMINA